jgi:hypothetical protein
MLEVIVGILFTFMLLSLLGTTLNELIAAWRGWRGFYLEEGLKRLLEFKDNPSVYEKFRKNVFYKQMLTHKAPLRISQAPAYLTSSNFTSILFNVLKKKDQAVSKVDDLIAGLPKDSQLREVLEQLKEEGHDNLDAYKARLQTWFDDVMSQSSGWYKRHLQFVTLFVGLAIAIVLNADSFAMYKHLTTNAAARQRLNALATNFMEQNSTLPIGPKVADTLAVKDIKAEVKKFLTSPEFSQTSNILGLGWSKEDLTLNPVVWLQRLLGWFITALAISLGAPFWFDVLKKIITIRSSGSSSGGGGGSGAPQVVIHTGKETSVGK